MTGDLPPSSSVTRLMVLAVRFWIDLPTRVEPVKAILSMPACVVMWSPSVGPSPVTTFSTPSGRPHSSRSSWAICVGVMRRTNAARAAP